MNADQVKSLVATLLKVIGGVLIAKGFAPDLVNGVTGNPDLISAVAGGVMAGAAAIWSHASHA